MVLHDWKLKGSNLALVNLAFGRIEVVIWCLQKGLTKDRLRHKRVVTVLLLKISMFVCVRLIYRKRKMSDCMSVFGEVYDGWYANLALPCTI